MNDKRLDRLAFVSKVWPWLFLGALLVFFEVWARIATHRSFIFNAYNLQSIGFAASAPLLLAIGQTFVIVTAGIDLSVGFVMGLAAVCVAQFTIPGSGSLWVLLLSIPLTILVCLIPGLVNGIHALRALANEIWQVHLCNRRQPAIGRARRHQCPSPSVGDLSDRGCIRRDWRHRLYRAFRGRRRQRGRADSARFDRGGRDRRREPVWRHGYRDWHVDWRAHHCRFRIRPCFYRRQRILVVHRGGDRDHRVGAD
nr:hypothetical protein [Paraburkholderia sacchari]